MKTLVTVIALSAATIFSAQAQDTRTAPKEEKRMDRVQPEQDMTKQVKMHTDKMTKDLGLSAEQSKRLMEENKSLYSDMASMKSRNAKEAEMKEMKENTMSNYDSKVKDILNDEQYRKYTTKKDDYMMDMHEKKMNKKANQSMDTKEDMPRK